MQRASTQDVYDGSGDDLNKLDSLKSVLNDVLSSLERFQVDLDVATSDIYKVSERSNKIQVNLNNLKAVESALGAEIDGAILPPDLIKTISTGDMDHPSWNSALEKLTSFLEGGEDDSSLGSMFNSLQINKDQKKLVDKLRDKAIERIRNYIVVTIKMFRQAFVDVFPIRKHRLIANKNYYLFLFKFNRKLALELQRAYINTMNWFYLYHFEQYSRFLDKVHVLKGETIRVEEDRKGLFNLSKGAQQSYGNQMLSVNLRPQDFDMNSVLTASTMHHIESSPQYIERVYCSWELVLTEHVSSEYAFLLEYFNLSKDQQATVFAAIFEKTLHFSRKYITGLISSSIDCIGILKSIRFTQKLALQAQTNIVPVIEPHYNSMILFLWPRFQAVMDMHCESLRKTNLSVKPEEITSRPHPLSQRVAELLYSLSMLSVNVVEAEPVARSASRLAQDYVSMLQNLCKTVNDKRRQSRFLSNNYTLISTVLSGVSGNLAIEQKTYFEKLNENLTNFQ
ncbi:GARP complex subunit Vps52 [Schizosaccharomyces pombe]